MGGPALIYWSSLTEFLNMGGYGPFVWGSFLVTGVAMALECWQIVQSRRRLIAQILEQAPASGESLGLAAR